VITEARRVVEEQAEDRTTVPLRGATATQALRGPWPYESPPAQPATDEPRPIEAHAAANLGLVALLLALVAVVGGVLVWWRR
jgi:hypothetical protein